MEQVQQREPGAPNRGGNGTLWLSLGRQALHSSPEMNMDLPWANYCPVR